MNVIDERYQNGKIYKIVCNETNEIYYGSTIEKYLCSRIAKHIYDNKCVSKHIINRNNYYYELVENYRCNNRYELKLKEKEYILNNKCINKNIPTRTNKEYKKENKEQIAEYHKEYREKNKEKINEKNRIYYNQNKELKVVCDICGSIVRKKGISRHRRTKFCLSKIDG